MAPSLSQKDRIAQLRAFAASPEGKEANRSTRQFLNSLGPTTWGYVIYRTVFTPDSDVSFPLAIEKLNAYVKAEVDRDLVGTQFDAGVNQAVWDKWRGIVVDDKENEGKGVDDIRAAFIARGGRRGVVEEGCCIMLDERGLQSLIDEDESGSSEPTLNKDGYVTMVDGRWVAGEGDSEYQGWMKVNVGQLMRLFDVLGISSLYQSWCSLQERDQDGAFIYDG